MLSREEVGVYMVVMVLVLRGLWCRWRLSEEGNESVDWIGARKNWKR